MSVQSCKEFVGRNVRYLIELGVVRRMLFVRRIARSRRNVKELRAVRSLLGEF